MISIIDKRNCCGCHACYNICPQRCIGMQSDNEGFWYPFVASDKCTDCGLCDKVCPIVNIDSTMNQPLAYACIYNNEEIRVQSSSGGLFTVIAEQVISNHGVVLGAGFDKDFNVEHSWTDSIEGLGKFRGSKYVQSRIGDTYNQVREFLQQGRQVLFSGTPCQIAGLRSYLGKDFENLIRLDIICHGVPSPLVWQHYKLRLEEEHRAKTRRIAFRNKNCGWKRFSLSILFDDETEYIEQVNEDVFLRGFLMNLYLRPSCYTCKFKTLNRQSDITLADFWGIEKVLPDFDDDQGTSLILVNSSKGAKIFASIADQLQWQKVDIAQAVIYNPSAVASVDYNPKRQKFFNEFQTSQDIMRLIVKYTNIGFPKQVYFKTRSLMGRIKRTFLG